MEKEILIQNLRERLGADKASVISEKSFDAFGEMWKDRFADDAKITDDTWKEPLTILSQFAGQKRHDDASFAQRYQNDYDAKMKAEWEKKIEAAKAAAIEAYKKEQDGGNESKNGGIDDNGAKSMEEIIAEKVAQSIGKLTSEEGEIGKLSKLISGFIEESNKRDRTAQLKTTKSNLAEYLRGLGASSEPTIEDAINDIQYGDKLDLEELKPQIKNAYEARYKRYFGDGGKPFGGGGHSGDFVNDETKDAISKRIAKLADDVRQQQSYQQILVSNFQ